MTKEIRDLLIATKLPCRVAIGDVTLEQGTSLLTLITLAKRWKSIAEKGKESC